MPDDERCHAEVALHQFHDDFHGNEGHHRRLEGRGCGAVVFACKIRPVAEYSYRLDNTYNLISSADAVFEYLHLSLDKKHHPAGAVGLVVDDFVLAELLHGKFFRNHRPLFIVQRRPQCAYLVCYLFFF